MYLERRRRLWYALHDIPANARRALGRKRFVQSLETESRKVAERRAAVLEARWRSDIEQARSGSADHLEQDAHFWRRAVRDASSDEQRELILGSLSDELDEKTYRAAAKAGITDARDPGFEELPERQEANRVFAIASGTIVRLDEHLEALLSGNFTEGIA